jgi:selenocysteine lyase/cysteine desulfurase
VNPVERIGALTRAAAVPFLLDACQSVGQMPVDVERIGCDMMAVTGRKFLRAPRGTGFLYVRRDLLDQIEPPFVDVRAADWVARDAYELRGDARRFESWETNYATKIGLGVAADYALGWGLEEIRDYNYALAARLRSGLAAVPGAEVLDVGRERCSIVAFTVEGHDPDAVARELSSRGINVSVSILEDARLDMESRGYDSWVRASVHYFNTAGEVEQLCAAVADITRPPRAR